MSSKEILHIHIERFYADVEKNRRPDLMGKPILVVETHGRNRHVISASRCAQRLGAVKNMSVRNARRICPDAVVVEADLTTYTLVLNAVMDICYCFSPVIEPDFPDGAWVDITGSDGIFGDPKSIASRITSEVYSVLGMELSVGCAPSKMIAKIASEMGKKLTCVEAGKESEFLSPLPVGLLDAVDRKIEKRLIDLGIEKNYQLAQIPEALLLRQFGKAASAIRRQALGKDHSPVRAIYPPDVIISEHSFSAMIDEPTAVFEYLTDAVYDLTASLRSRNRLAGGITLTLFDESGSAIATSEVLRLKKPVDSLYAIISALGKLLSREMKPGMCVSGIRIALSELTVGVSQQLSLVGTDTVRTRLDRTIEQINARFGDGKIRSASSIPTRNVA